MIQLHYYPSTAGMIPHILLEELGVPYEPVVVDRTVGAHKAPAYLKLNPNGLIPVLTDGDLVLYETAAIALHLCDTHPQAALAPSLGTTQRAHFYKWLMWLTNTLQSALIIYFYGERWMNEGNAAGAAELKANAQQKIGAMLDQLDAHLAGHGGPWFMGAELFGAGRLCVHAVPLDAQFQCSPCARTAASGAVPAAGAGAPSRAARDGQREAGAAVRLISPPATSSPETQPMP
jgi:glutathione S-transferase